MPKLKPTCNASNEEFSYERVIEKILVSNDLIDIYRVLIKSVPLYIGLEV